ncbi:MAG TPA: glycerol-3-phosphate 1-O-acyltransferase PlsY [Thermodesulfobacteriota bacterium]|nr:glycerol-3-phosphate 1-O-acyltransferase PlsY [Thermodesulfobacteriota bacterium]
MAGGALVVAAYLLGSLPVGLLVGRAYGVDVRRRGSGNIGTANVLRSVGRTAGALTLAGDALKGFLPVFVARALLLDEPWVLATALAALLGATYSVFLGFGGGKGVATSLGILAALAWELALLGVVVYLPVVALTRISSLGSLAAAAALPVAAFFAYGRDLPPNRFHLLLVMAALVFWRHRDNLRRLAAGTEPRLGGKRP